MWTRALKHESNNPHMVYCGAHFCGNSKCFCRGCDGNCGPSNGCPCSSCLNTLFASILSLKLKCPFGDHLYSVIRVSHLPDRISCALCHSNFSKSSVGRFCDAPALMCDCNPEYAYVCPNCTNARLVMAMRKTDTSVPSAEKQPDSSSSRSFAKCMSCVSSVTSCAFIPCGHVCMCDECAEQWLSRNKICPFCRADCQRIQHLYFL